MKIALTFSGGGYRASAFNLGTLTYLDKVLINKDTLLNKVVVLSTVSGGTITGAKYAIGIKKGDTLKDIYTSLYKFFLEVDLISLSLDHLKSSNCWSKNRVRSLINSFADIYDKLLFKNDKFGVLLDDNGNPIHLKHIAFNATEFTTGLQFRFQISEKILFPRPDEPNRGIIGNRENIIPEYIAKEIRMGDIVASSSCFPAGFEPINFPTDFVLPETKEIEQFMQNEKYPIGLMDGGIVDNQGIEPVILAEERMKRNNPDKNDNILDLIIVSDVSSPYMKSFSASLQHKDNWWRRLTMKKVLCNLVSLLTVALVSLFFSVFYFHMAWAILSAVIITLSIILFTTLWGIRMFIIKNKMVDPSKLKGIIRIKFGTIEDMIRNRINSLLDLTSSVFMKHIRRLNYNKVYGYEHWKNRRIMNAIYELRKGEKKIDDKNKRGELKDYLLPSIAIQEVSRIASDMGTTLWFEKQDKDSGVLDAIIACGQYNVCWNLLEYIEKIKNDTNNTNDNHKLLLLCEQQLKADWEKFKEDPFWLVKKYNEK